MDFSRRDFLSVAGIAATLRLPDARALHEYQVAQDDPLGVRKDFPALRDFTFLNTAYTGLIPQVVVEASREWIATRAGRTYTVGEMLAKADEVRRNFAAMFGAAEDEIAFLSSTTEGENLVVNSLDFKPGDNVVYDDLVYPSTPAIYQRLADTKGVEIRVVKSRNGATPVEEFARLVNNRTRLISVAWINNNSGYRHDMKTLAALAHAHGAYLYSDAVQFMGTGPVDLHAEGVDFCTSGTYKWLLAGFGVAVFYVRSELLNRITPSNVGWRSPSGPNRTAPRTSAKQLEYATLPFGDLYELDAALKYLRGIGLDKIETRSQALVQRFRSGLAKQKIPIATPDNTRSPIVSFYTRMPVAEATKILDAERIKVSPQNLAPPDPAAGAGRATRVRVAMSFFNNEADIDRMLEVATKLV
jgi:selenocysteine lyase/cysteine desulfurase